MLDKLMAGSFLIFGLVYLFMAHKLPFGSFTNPNTGYVPKLFAVILILLALINFSIEMKKPSVKNKELKEVDWKKAVLFITGCVLYIVLMKLLGYLLATLIALWLFIKFTGIKGYQVPLMVTVGVSFFFYVVFTKILAVPLPAAPRILSQVIPFLK